MRVGFIGLGMMGKGMAANLQKAGHDLVVYDLRRAAAEPYLAKGAVWADRPKAVGEQSEVVFTSLPVPADVEAVALGAQRADRGHAARTPPSSTCRPTRWRWYARSTPPWPRRTSTCSTRRSAAAPAARPAARWRSGSAATSSSSTATRAVLDAMGDQAAYIGPIGAGTIAKLVHNCTSAVLGVALAEVMTMGIKAGVDPLELWEAVRQGATGRQRTFDRLGANSCTASTTRPISRCACCTRTCRWRSGSASEVGVPMRLANLALRGTDRGDEPRLGPPRQPVGQALAGRALRHPAAGRRPRAHRRGARGRQGEISRGRKSLHDRLDRRRASFETAAFGAFSG